MIKSKLRLFGWAVGLSLALGAVGAVAAQGAPVETKAGDATYSMTPDGETTGSSATAYITSLTEFTYSGIKWQMNQWNPSTLQIKTNQSNAANEFRFYNTSAFGGRIKQVVITFSAFTVSDASKLMFVGGGSKVTATSGGSAGTWNSSAKTITWTPAADTEYTFFAFYQNGKAASGTNYLASSNAIRVTYETPTLTSVSVKNAPTKTSGYKAGDSVDLTELVVTPSINSKVADDVTYNSATNASLFTTNPAVLAADTTSVQIGYRLTNTDTFVYDTAHPVAITMSTVAVDGIIIDADTITGKTWYNVDTLDLTGLKYMLSYDDSTFGEEVTIASNADFTAKGLSLFEGENEVDLSQPLASGAHTYTVKYGDFGDSFEISVTARIVTTLAIDGKQKKAFLDVDTFSVEGGTITATYNNGDVVSIPASDSHLAYSIENSTHTKLYDLVIGETVMIAEFAVSNRYVQIQYDNGVGVAEASRYAKLTSRYSVTVTHIPSTVAFENSSLTLPGGSGYKSGENLADSSGYTMGATNIMKGTVTSIPVLQLKASTGEIHNVTAWAGNISTISVKGPANITTSNLTLKVGSTASSVTTSISGRLSSDESMVLFDVSGASGTNAYKYFKLSAGSSYVGFSELKVTTASDEADAFASSFNTAIASECAAKNVVSGTWTAQTNAFGDLSKAAKNIFANTSIPAEPTEQQVAAFTEVEHAVSRHDFIVKKYAAYDDFMGRGVVTAGLGAKSILTSGIEKNAIVFVAAFAGVGALAVGGMVFLRKRKEF